VPALLGQKKDAVLTSAGVDLLNTAFSDYLDPQNPQNPVLVFSANGDVSPNPSQNNRIVFDWQACIRVNVVIEQTLEVPEPPL